MILSIQRRAGQGKGQTPAHCSLPKRPQSTSRTVQASVSRAFQASGTAAPEFVQQLKREVREGGPFKTFSLLTAYLHCVQLAAFLSQVHFPECTTANGLHYGELLNGGWSWYRDPTHALLYRRTSFILLTCRGGLHCCTARPAAATPAS